MSRTNMAGTKDPTDVFRAYLKRQELVSGGVVSPRWTSDGEAFWFAEGAPENTVILRVDLKTASVLPMFDVTAVRAALKAATGHDPPYNGLPFESFTPLKDGRVAFTYSDVRWVLQPETSRLEQAAALDSFSNALGWLSEDAPVPKTWKRYDYLSVNLEVPEELSPNEMWYASIRDHNVVVRPARARGGREQPLTFDGTRDCFWDIEALRFQLFSGRRVGFRGISPWSPDSLTLLAYQRDITGVFKSPRVNWLMPFEDVEYLPYQKVGSRLDRIQPVFLDVRSRRQTPVLLKDIEDRYIQLLAWRADSAEALVIVYTRDFKRVDILAADGETGAVRLLLTETATTFVKNQHESMFYGEHGFRLLPDGGFLWLSTRDGWNHIYRYNIKGELIGQLTCGEWPVHDIAHLGTEGFIYFTASIDTGRPYDVHVCRVPLSGGRIEQLTRECGLHSPAFAPRSQSFLDTHSSVDRPTRTDLVKADGTQLRVLSTMDTSRIEAVGYISAEEFTVKAADGTSELWGVLYKPFNFDAAGSYPIIEYIYGGPQSVEAPHFFAVDKTMMSTMQMPWALAHLGYIVVCLDARGTPGRSKAFHEAVCDNFTVGIADHAAAIEQLCKQHAWMDPRRVGITGHSWGGYFSTAALIQAPDTYHAAVSYAPAYDPWDAIYYEPYLGLKDSAAFERADLIKQASKVKGRLMIVSGTSDSYGFSPAMKMTWALIEARIDHEFVVVPQAFHEFVGAEDDYLMMKLTGWFDRHVKNRSVG